MLSFWQKFTQTFKQQKNVFATQVAAIIGFKPKNIQLYQLAFTHSSAAIEHKGQRLNNERLEFLGDAVLGSIVSAYLYNFYPKKSEGFLTSMRSKIVCRKHLNKLSLSLGLDQSIVHNTTQSHAPQSIYGDALEALIGAVYLDLGWEPCKRFIEYGILEKHVRLSALSQEVISYKRLLIEWAAKNKKKLFFKLEAESGESHNKRFELSLWCQQKQVAVGAGRSKKRAEEEAAKAAYHELAVNYERN